MKLKIYNKLNSATLRRGKPTVRVNSKSGLVSFNTFACDALSLKEGKGVLLVRDETRPQDWYVMKSNSEDAFILHWREKPNRHGCAIHSKVLSETILSSLDTDSISVSFLVATEPVIHNGFELYAIITKSMNAR